VSARTTVARLAGVKPRAVIFTSGATEANAIALQGRIEQCNASGTDYRQMHVLYLPTMHSSVLKTVQAVSEKGVVVEEIPLQKGEIDLEEFAKRVRPETVLVCCDAVCGETGARHDTLRLKRALEAGSSTAALHVDASQLPLEEPIERTRLGADLLVLDAQKVGGIRGAGALIVSNRSLITPIAHGGGQEDGLRPGTEPVALIAAFAEALSVCSERNKRFAQRAEKDRARLVAALTKAIPEGTVHSAKRQSHHILNISLSGFDTDYAVALLDRDGFAVSTRSACETDSEDGSKAVYVRTQDARLASATLRISWGPDTPSSDLVRFAKALPKAVTFLRRR
jgi:cysteine desulfurase